MSDIKFITVSQYGIYNIYFENGGAIFNAAKHEKYKDYIEQNKNSAISFEEYQLSLKNEPIEETVEEIGVE